MSVWATVLSPEEYEKLAVFLGDDFRIVSVFSAELGSTVNTCRLQSQVLFSSAELQLVVVLVWISCELVEPCAQALGQGLTPAIMAGKGWRGRRELAPRRSATRINCMLIGVYGETHMSYNIVCTTTTTFSLSPTTTTTKPFST